MTDPAHRSGEWLAAWCPGTRPRDRGLHILRTPTRRQQRKFTHQLHRLSSVPIRTSGFPKFSSGGVTFTKLRFPDSAESALFPPTCTGRSKFMSQTAYALLIFIGLTLTGYFGLAAWQSSSEDRVTTGTIHSR
jgi:hypothetical protein